MTRVEAAMVLAAGRGTRMAELSDVLPKPALPLPGGAVVEWPVGQACRASGGTVVVNSWHLAERLETVVGAADLGECEVCFSRENELMDTAGGIALARDRGLLGEHGPVLVLNGDCVLRVQLETLFERHAEGEDLVTLALLPHLDPRLWSRVVLDGDGRVTAIRSRGLPAPGEVPFLYTGAMVVSREALAAIPSGVGGIWDHLWRPAMEQTRLGGAVVTGHWREVGTPRAYRQTVVELLAGRTRVHPTAEVADEATVVSSLIGEGVTVGAGAVVSESIISHGATVAPGAKIIASILLGPVTTGDGEKITNEVRTRALPPSG